MRIGQGFDVHAFAPNRRLILGGVNIPHGVGLLGHSDADVVLHAVMDALLGALALGDIGHHFPDTNPHYKDADSAQLLGSVMDLVEAEGYEVANVDCTVMAQVPKLAPHISQMRSSMAHHLRAPVSSVSVKATTTERLGFVGREEGIAALAVVLLQRRGNRGHSAL
jgi:2-C-methyl-D-erythritol 2,4-cyclodiphosphate synthase